MESLSQRDARRLALARGGLLKPEWTGFPTGGSGRGNEARAAAHAIVDAFGYLQLDTVSIAGARSHAIVLMSRLVDMSPSLGEELLAPSAPLFEYWGHEASWIPMSMYPLFSFRRELFRKRSWWKQLIEDNPTVVGCLRHRLRNEGPLRSADMEGPGGRGWWDFKIAKRVATALWSSGEIAIRERKRFQRTYDLAERVIPETVRKQRVGRQEALRTLLLKALAGHGWATTGTLAATWRLRNLAAELKRALATLVESGDIVSCVLEIDGKKPRVGWIRPDDLELAARLRRVRPRSDRGVLLSPFDPVLWDRGRVAELFNFEQVLEIFKPAGQRKYGYFCLPVLAGESLVARVDLKADRINKTLSVLSRRYERARPSAADKLATARALSRFAGSLKLSLS